MTDSLPISACITTKNNQDTIERCLESLEGWTDEIVVVDSGSTDKTIDICEEYGAKIYQIEFNGFASIKNAAIERAENQWVFVIDSDEWVPKELRMEIFEKFDNDIVANRDAFMIKKENKMFGRWMHIDHPSRPLLANKDCIHFEGEYIHERLSVKNTSEKRVELLSGKVKHLAYRRVSEKIEKIDQYASLQALEYSENASPTRLWFAYRSVGTFLYYYLYSGGIQDRYEGFIYSALEMLQVLICYQKMAEIESLKKQEDNWREIWLSQECRR